MRTLIKNAFVVSVDPRIGNLDGADILIEGSRIVDVRPGIVADDVAIFDATGHIVCPGFIDTHHHIWQSAIRGITADWSLRDYVVGIRLAIAAAYEPEDMYAAELNGALGALRVGVTTTADYCHNLNSADHVEESIRGIKDSGARIVWCYGFNQPPLPAPAFTSLEQRVDYLHKTAQRHFSSRDGLVTLGVSPEEPRFWPDITHGARQFAAAREVDARIFWHANSSKGLAHNDYRHDALKAADAGLLASDVTLVHMNQSEQREWDRVAEAGAHLSLTPETELQMNMGWPPLAAARSRDINVSLGIDILSNNNADLRFQARLMLQAERYSMTVADAGAMRRGVPIKSAEALYWATMGGARAVGLDHCIGSITPGKEADLQIHDARGVSMVGWDRSSPEGALLLQADTGTLSAVLVAGKFVKRDHRLTGNEAQSCALLTRANERVLDRIASKGGVAGVVGKDLRDFAASEGGIR